MVAMTFSKHHHDDFRLNYHDLTLIFGSTIQKKSREETSGTGSGVEIIVNEPYDNGPGGSGQ